MSKKSMLFYYVPPLDTYHLKNISFLQIFSLSRNCL